MVNGANKRARPGLEYGGPVELIWYRLSDKKDWSGCSCSRCGEEIGLEDPAVLLWAKYDRLEALLCKDCSWELLGIE